MQETGRASLVGLIWWSVRLAWARNKTSRRRFRQKIWDTLSLRWRFVMPNAQTGTELAIVRAVWLGAALASRSLVRYPLLPGRLKTRLTWLVRLLGKTNGKAVVAAYLAWTWLNDVAHSTPSDAAESWGNTGG
ncbi:hypothetical protein [Sulfobacillus harzensis]|uniref:Uncharacterized protein n=1 Tax=Sulfobacillus harzensis TaxID=2729629 RepID=A0A7Y0Q0H8_9FIRM|nr:hypothetical protein [Sulfobacillus harzensis]NMP21048.1 hypothetical protein [Sulfobacillus harzensis]